MSSNAPEESARLRALEACNVLDTPPERSFDDLTAMMAEICEVPISLVSLVASDRQWFKSRVGLEAASTPREHAFCNHAIARPNELLIVPDAHADPRFANNPLVTGEPGIRFYAGAPLVDRDGHALGTLCVVDRRPRQLDPRQLERLRQLGRQVMALLQQRRDAAELDSIVAERANLRRELQEFAHLASHDLRAPLRHVRTCASFLTEDLAEERTADAAETMALLLGATDRLENMFEGLLLLSRAGSAPGRVESADLGELVDGVLDPLRPALRERGVSVEVPDLPTVDCIPDLVAKLFEHLIRNALDHAGEAPEVRLTVEQSEAGTVFGVQDDGPGIEQRFAESVFSPFRRLDPHSPGDGPGMGLTVARRLVERHAGRIWVADEPGAGCHVRFTLRPDAPARSTSTAA